MDAPEEQRVPTACALNGEQVTQRRERWRALGAHAKPAVVRPDAGTLEVRYMNSSSALAELQLLAALEADCCAFLTWDVARTSTEAILTIRPAPGAAQDVSHDLAGLAGMITGEND